MTEENKIDYTQRKWTCARCHRDFTGGGVELVKGFGYGVDAEVCMECHDVVTDDPPNFSNDDDRGFNDTEVPDGCSYCDICGAIGEAEKEPSHREGCPDDPAFSLPMVPVPVPPPWPPIEKEQ